MMRTLATVLSVIWGLFGAIALGTPWTQRSAKVIFIVLASATAVTLFYCAYHLRWS